MNRKLLPLWWSTVTGGSYPYRGEVFEDWFRKGSGAHAPNCRRSSPVTCSRQPWINVQAFKLWGSSQELAYANCTTAILIDGEMDSPGSGLKSGAYTPSPRTLLSARWNMFVRHCLRVPFSKRIHPIKPTLSTKASNVCNCPKRLPVRRRPYSRYLSGQ